MEDNEMKEFSWTAFYVVTGFSLILFSKILQVLDGTPLPAFNRIGVIAIILGSLYYIVTLKGKSEKG